MILGPCLSITGSKNHNQHRQASTQVAGIMGGRETGAIPGLYYINP